MRAKSAPRGAALPAATLLLLALTLGGCAAIQHAASPFFPAPPPLPINHEDAATLDDATISRRVDFIAQRLDAAQTHAAAWEYGWLAVNGGGVVASSVLAANDDNRDDRAYDIIDAVKGAIGTAYQLFTPMPGTEGADPILAMPTETHDEKVAQLRAAESILADAASRADQRTTWPLHVGNLGMNLVGGAILLGLNAPGLAAQSFFIDAAVGEVQIFTQPWEPVTDWADYQHFVATGDDVPRPTETTWHLVPRAGGAAVQASF